MHRLEQRGDCWVAQQLVCKFNTVHARMHRVCEGHEGDTGMNLGAHIMQGTINIRVRLWEGGPHCVAPINWSGP